MVDTNEVTTAYRCTFYHGSLDTTPLKHVKRHCTPPKLAAKLLELGRLAFVAEDDMAELRLSLNIAPAPTPILPTQSPVANGHGYWPDHRLHSWIMAGGITPFNETEFTLSLNSSGRLINPASVDLPLDNTARRIRRYEEPPVIDFDDKSPDVVDRVWSPVEIFDELLFHPGECVLLSTGKTVTIPRGAIAFVYLKSSTGRKAIEHLHAGLADPAFDGQLTLEVINHSGVIWRLKPGNLLVQLTLCDLSSEPVNPYTATGRYVGQVGATAWRP